MNWENKTLFVGDNLYVLRGMNSESVDLLYLDPPFNSNRNYAAPIGSQAAGAAFKDAWTLSDVNLMEHQQLKKEHPGLYAVIDAAGTAHSKGMKSYLIMMAVRLLEMRRLLKETGSLYLHCDPTASHYLKLVLDAVFGAKNFRNEITWRRAISKAKGSQHQPKSWGSNTDTILFYSKKEVKIWPYRELTEVEIAKKFPKIDENGQRYKDDSAHIWRTPNMGARENLCYEWRGFTNPHPSGWRLSKERLEEEYQKGNIRIRDNGKLERRAYLKDYRGEPVGNLWDDILPPPSKERVGYPTQKPRALLDRILSASSNPGDVILDPFCGCATTLVAADRLRRQWVGIDLSAKAGDLVTERIKADQGGLFEEIHVREDIPQRTDQGPPLTAAEKRHHKKVLYGLQVGRCNGCNTHFERLQDFHMDHIVARARGGTDHAHNFQLLCGHCNSVKGKKTQAEFMAIMAEKRTDYSWM